jgi:diguanylate cyclase (GGDEF)-like protein
MHDLSALHTLVLNSLEEQIAVIDQSGNIIDVNSSWNRFGESNGLPFKYGWIGRNYLDVLQTASAKGDSLAGEASQGILDVVNGQRDYFYCEYPCHSPNQKRWFMMRVAPIKDHARFLFVVSHHDITARKSAEQQAEYLAMHDSLTGLANRRCFNQFLHREIRSAIRHQTRISLIEIDVDHFKDYNDEWGHLAGDECLSNVATTLQTYSRRPNDLAARLGGDEFALLLGDTTLVEAEKIAQAIVRSIRELNMFFAGSKLITVSIGVAAMIPQERHSQTFLLQEADKALYAAKLAGRNCVRCAQTA